MLQLVEMEGKMTENGCIEIPAVVLEQAGICTGDTVKLVYMAEDGELKNTAKEFLLARAGQDVAEELAKEENIAFQIPEELLRDAGIPMDADLDIVCQEGRIIILPSELVQGTKVPEELLAICRELGITEDKVNIILRTTEEGTDEKPVYKLLDEKGRILIPKEFRQMAELESGDIVKLSVSSGKIMVSKVDIVEMGSQDPQAVEAYINAAVKHMSPAKQVALAARILKFAQQEGGTDC